MRWRRPQHKAKMTACAETLERVQGVDESNIMSAIIAAASLGALGLVVAQLNGRLSADGPMRTFGFIVAASMLASSIILVLSSLMRHYLNKKGRPATRTDVIFYVGVAIVMFSLAVAMLWLAISSFLVGRKK